jgi:long-chain fatty acid transport protein
MKLQTIVVFLSLIAAALIPGAGAAAPAFSGITANADTADTVVNNPAGMMRFKEPSGYGNPMLVYTNSKDKVTVDSTGKSESSSDDSFFALPGFYYVHPMGEQWAVGIGPNGAAGLGGSYDDDWVGRYLVQDWSLAFAGIAPAIAYRVHDKLSLGVSLQVMYSRFTLEKAVFNPGADDGSFELTADGWGMGTIVGTLYEITPNTRLGLTYRSKVSVTDEGKPDLSGLTSEREEGLNQTGALHKKISIDTSVPQSVNAGVFHDFGNGWSSSLDVAWIDFSSFGLENVTIGDTEITTPPGEFKDIWAATLGVSYELNPQWTIKSGTFYFSSAQDDKDRQPSLRLDQMWGIGLGFDYAYRKNRSVAVDLTYIQFGDGEYTAEDVPLAGTIEGKYTSNYGLLLGLGMKW